MNTKILKLFSEIQKLKFIRLKEKLKEFKIHPGQIPLLLIVHKNPGLSQKEIARHLLVSSPTIAVMLRRMEKNNFIKKKLNPEDRREYKVFLTEKGKKIMEVAKEEIEKFEKSSLKGFSKEEIKILEGLLKKIVKNLKGEENVKIT